MKKLAIFLFLALTLGFVGVIAAAMLQPKDYQMQRSIAVNASASNVFTLLTDLKRFDEWSPWAKLDTGMKKTFEGNPGTEGQTYGWAGNDQVGEGRMTVTKIIPNQLVEIKLDFIRPFTDTATTTWSVKEEGSATTVTWAMAGERKTLFQKTMGLLLPMDSMIGKDFENGLASLKTIVEGTPPAPSPRTAEPVGEPAQTN